MGCSSHLGPVCVRVHEREKMHIKHGVHHYPYDEDCRREAAHMYPRRCSFLNINTHCSPYPQNI